MKDERIQAEATQSEHLPDEATQSESKPSGADESQAQPTQAPQKPEGPTGTQEAADDLTDRHGQPAIARGKYERDMAAKDEEIAKLTAQVEEMSKTEDGRKQMQEQIESLKAEIASDKVNHALELAGCVNVKAARAVLDDHDGDVAKLKESCPYLFAQEKPKAGSTGLPASGAPDSGIDEKLDRAFGLKKK